MKNNPPKYYRGKVNCKVDDRGRLSKSSESRIIAITFVDVRSSLLVKIHGSEHFDA